MPVHQKVSDKWDVLNDDETEMVMSVIVIGLLNKGEGEGLCTEWGSDRKLDWNGNAVTPLHTSTWYIWYKGRVIRVIICDNVS